MVPSSSAKVTERVVQTQVVRITWLVPGRTVDQAMLAQLLATDRALPRSDLLPTTDRLIDFCRLLI
jgi:hypothetical protein